MKGTNMNKIKLSFVSIVALALLGGTALATVGGGSYASAACSGIDCAKDGADNVKTGGANSSNLDTAIKTITNILLFIIGAVSVIMLIIGGLKYVMSNGSADAIKSAKNTILYAIIGIIVAIAAYAIIEFVVSKLT
jgi:hypothetical protein